MQMPKITSAHGRKSHTKTEIGKPQSSADDAEQRSQPEKWPKGQPEKWPDILLDLRQVTGAVNYHFIHRIAALLELTVSNLANQVENTFKPVGLRTQGPLESARSLKFFRRPEKLIMTL